MRHSYNNFGLSGQQEADYDQFLCFNRRCRERKKERHKARMEKKASKTDSRTADTERIRAETNILQQTAAPAPTPAAVVSMPLTGQQIANPQVLAPRIKQPVPPSQKAGFGGNTIMIALAVILVGGYMYQKSKNNKQKMHQQLQARSR